MSSRTNTELIEAVDEVLAATVALARGLSEADGERPTDCPGWTVKDQVAHMVGLEQVLAGAPEPDVDLPALAHVQGDVATYMEKPVHIRRPLPLVAVTDELAGLRTRRVEQLRALAAEGDPPVKGPFGDRPLSAALPFRVFDLWAHEQDIRRAVGLPARIDGPAAAISLERSLAGWAGALPRELPELNAELVVRVTGAAPSETTVVLGAGGPQAVLTGDLGDVTRVFCGRIVPGDDLLSGDPAAVAALRDHLGLTP